MSRFSCTCQVKKISPCSKAKKNKVFEIFEKIFFLYKGWKSVILTLAITFYDETKKRKKDLRQEN